MKIEYPIDWDEREQYERASKGWLEDVFVTTDDGARHRLVFWDLSRLQQDLEEEMKEGKMAIIERGLIIVPEVTKENIEKAIKQANDEGYFKND